jgi:ABC-2 type transport system ATP-binding protein
LTLDVYRGEVFGFLGPNGAGKSTSIKMLLGLVGPTGGSATILGEPIGNREMRTRIGFLPEHFRFYDWLTPVELLRLHGQLHGLSRETLRDRIPRMLDLVGLTLHRDKQIGKFSKGMMQRIGLAQALLNDPDLIFLDEPTSGLDPVGRRLVRDVIRAQRERGATVFLNSHLLSEVEVTCDRVAFIRAGQVIEVREMSSFSEQRSTIFIRARGVSDSIIKALTSCITVINRDDEQLTITVNSSANAPKLLKYLVDSGVEVFEFTPKRLSLEDRFLEILGHDEGL